MPEPTPPPNPSQAAPPPAPPAGPTINIGEEFGTAKRNLPPAKIVAITIAAVLIVVGIVSILKRATPQGSGSLNKVVAAEIPGQTSTMVALTFTLKNTGEKVLYVRTIRGKITTPSGEFSGDAVSAIDFNRYFQAFPTLQDGVQPALTPETKLQPGEEVTRTAIVAFPVTLDAFNQRKSTSVVIQPYDQQLPVTITR